MGSQRTKLHAILLTFSHGEVIDVFIYRFLILLDRVGCRSSSWSMQGFKMTISGL